MGWLKHMAGYLPQMELMDVTPALRAYSLGSKEGQEETDRNILREIGQVAAKQGLGAASNVALSRGAVGTGLKLSELSLDRQSKMYDFLGRAAVAADTPEKWGQYIGILSKQFGPESVRGFEDFRARESAILLSKNAFDLVQQRRAMGEFSAAITQPQANTGTVASAGEPRGIRLNNPLNIEAGPFAQSIPGFQGSDGRFARFASLDQGIAAADRLLSVYGQQGINTVAGVINKWAPPTENNSRAYAATVAKALGVDPGAQINLADPAVRQKLIGAMAQVENGRPLPQSSDQGYSTKVLQLIQAANNPGLPQAQREIAGKLLEHALKAGDLPEDVRKYEYAVRQGYRGSFQEWDITRRREASTRVTQVNRGEDAAAKAMGERFGKKYGEYIDAGDNAFAQLGTIATMRQLSTDPSFTSGALTERVILPLKQAIAAMGGDPKSAASMEAFRALANKSVIDSMGGSLGTGFSNADRDFVTSQVPSLGNTPQGNEKLFAVMEKIARRKIDVARMAQEYVQQPDPETGKPRGRLDAGFDRMISEWRERNPLFSDAERAEINQVAEDSLPKVGTVVDGWRFKGGNRADRNNWERVK